MVFLNLVVFASWPLTATLPHSTLLSLPHVVVVAPLFMTNIATAIPKRKHTAMPRINFVSSCDRSCFKSDWCLNTVVSFSARAVLRSSARRRSLSLISFLAFCTLVYSLRASAWSYSSLASCSLRSTLNAFWSCSKDSHFCT